MSHDLPATRWAYACMLSIEKALGRPFSGEEAAKVQMALLNPPDYVLVPKQPEPERIESMCIRFDHSHGVAMPRIWDGDWSVETADQHKQRQEANRRQMRQLYEEATGQGFYNDRTHANYSVGGVFNPLPRRSKHD